MKKIVSLFFAILLLAGFTMTNQASASTKDELPKILNATSYSVSQLQ
ncbi:hypothetical protein [Sporosarcina cyprini]|nr:hypothetical protein [Sporosarcina cyprini]MCG3088105.1 hypothetical protein [Sporosarcina cyprini]